MSEQALCRLISRAPPPLDPTIIDAHCLTPHKMYVCARVFDAGLCAAALRRRWTRSGGGRWAQ